MPSLRRDLTTIAAFTGFLAVAVVGGWWVTTDTLTRLLKGDAEASARGWASYLAETVADLDTIVAGATPSAESLELFAQAQRVGNVFRYKIFGPDGSLRLVSDDLASFDAARSGLAEHNPTAAGVLATGAASVTIAEGVLPTHPRLYTEAYVPVVVDGVTIGIVEVYIDHTGQIPVYWEALRRAAAWLTLIIGMAVIVPCAAFYWRTRGKRRSDARVEFLARHDAMTGLLNRVTFAEALERAFAAGRKGTLFFVDVDHFKEINDSLGSAVGDAVLTQLTRRMALASPDRSLKARLGSDEFAVALYDVGEDQAAGYADAIRASLSTPAEVDGREVDVTVSVGYAVAPADGPGVERLIRNADTALHSAKANGPAAVRRFHTDMEAELRDRAGLEHAIRNAVKTDSFRLHYQPVFRTLDRKLVGFEALLRLSRADGTEVPPAVFVPIAEKMGLIAEIGAWVLARAAREAAAWPGDLSVAVNLSARQFESGLLPEIVASALAASGLPPEQLELEITESLLLVDADTILAQLRQIKLLGVDIAMDDFGTGFSSLSYLWKFPFDKLKIDRSFLSALDAGGGVEQVIRTIVSLARTLKMTVTAEGVETAAQIGFLEEVGCDQVQGFLLGRPMPTEMLAVTVLRDFVTSGNAHGRRRAKPAVTGAAPPSPADRVASADQR